MRPARTSILTALLALAAALSPAANAAASDYPAKPVRLITQGAAGSGPDVITRIIAAHLAKRWGQQVLVVNHAGGGGVLAGRAAATADPDGYTLYVPTITTFVIMPEIQPNASVRSRSRLCANRLLRRDADDDRRGAVARRQVVA